MKITILPRAEKEFRKLPKFDQIAVAQKIRSLSRSNSPGEEKLSGYANVYRIRVGNYRIVYRKVDMGTSINIVLIRHRRDVYRLLKEILA